VLAQIESEIMEEANKLGVGAMGFGGKASLIGCKIAAANRLPASFFVSVAYGLWPSRRLWLDAAPIVSMSILGEAIEREERNGAASVSPAGSHKLTAGAPHGRGAVCRGEDGVGQLVLWTFIGRQGLSNAVSGPRQRARLPDEEPSAVDLNGAVL